MNDGMQPDSRIYVAGHRGLVGSALLRQLERRGFRSIIVRTHAELELTEQSAVREFFDAERPDYVFLAAAKVGGIHANSTYPAEFIYSNLTIQTNIIHEAWRHNVKRLLFLGSSCIYPKQCPQPIKETSLLTGPLEETNRPYALAKIAGVEMCWSYNRQYATRYLAAMPTNLYGPGDNYDLNNSHVLPALIRKVHEAKQRQDAKVVIWGSGIPRREFLYSDDMADACLHLMNLDDVLFNEVLGANAPPLVNIGYGEDLSILELAELVKETLGYAGSFVLDPGKPDGVVRKLLDVSRLNALGWRARTSLKEGIRLAYADFLGKP